MQSDKSQLHLPEEINSFGVMQSCSQSPGGSLPPAPPQPFARLGPAAYCPWKGEFWAPHVWLAGSKSRVREKEPAAASWRELRGAQGNRGIY